MVENSLKSYECDNLIFTCTIQSIYESILHWLLHIIWEVGGVNCLQTAFYYWEFFFSSSCLIYFLGQDIYMFLSLES